MATIRKSSIACKSNSLKRIGPYVVTIVLIVEVENDPDELESGLEVPFPRKEEIVLNILSIRGSDSMAVMELPFGTGGRPEFVTPLTDVEVVSFSSELNALVSLNSMKYREIPITDNIDA